MVSALIDERGQAPAHSVASPGPVGGELELGDYLYILKFRRKYFITVALVIMLLSVFYAMRWSNYRSVATVEVAPPDISSSTAAPMGMSEADKSEALADLRISHLEQKVLSTGSLVDIITKYDLYSGARKYSPVSEIADNMRNKIKLELVSSALANPASAQSASAGQLSAIAFTLSFDYSNPLLAQQVTNELVSRFLDEDLKERHKEAEDTSAFLGAQIKALEASLDEQEKKISDFRAANEGTEPESLMFNQQAAESIMMNIQSVNEQLTSNEGTQGSLRAQLASVDPYSRVIADGQVLTTPAIQLKALKSQYATLSGQYGPDHPDVVKLRHQIAALQKQSGGGTGSGSHADTAELQEKIADVRTNLAAAQKTYGPDHPDVVSLQHQLSKLQKELAAASSDSDTADGIKGDADNPAYLQFVAQLKSAEEQHKSLLAQKDALLKQQEKYQHAVAQNPAAAQKLAALSRDYDNSQLRYRELKEKKMAADMSAAIQQDRSGQRLVLIDPPELPTHTHPSRMGFVIGGFFLAIAGGLGSVALAQFISRSVVGPHHLESLVGVAPLVTIPHLFTEAEINHIGSKRLKAAALAFVAVILAAVVFSYMVMPLDVLWVIIGRWFGVSDNGNAHG